MGTGRIGKEMVWGDRFGKGRIGMGRIGSDQAGKK